MQNWSEEIFVVRKMKNTVPRTSSVSNYATKTDLKNATHVDTSNFALKTNLASLKTEVDKLDKLTNLNQFLLIWINWVMQ